MEPLEMILHESTFEYLKPTVHQVEEMEVARHLFREFALSLEPLLPDGADRAHVMRLIRTAAMWAAVAITRHPDGTPRKEK